MEFTPRNAAKYVAKAIVHGTVAKHVSHVIADHTRFEDDDMIVEIPSHMVGWYVSDKLKPITDTMVDKAADYIAAKRSKRNTTETAPTEK